MKGQNKAQTARKEKMSQTKDDEQTIKRLNGSDHERFEPHITFLRAEHDFHTPTVGVIVQNRFILQGRIGAEKDAQRSGLAKGIYRVGEQHHSVRDLIERSFVAMHQIGPAFHCDRVKLVWQEGLGVIHSGRFLPVWIQNAVSFHRTDEETALFLTSMQNVGVGVPAVHQEVSPSLETE